MDKIYKRYYEVVANNFAKSNENNENLDFNNEVFYETLNIIKNLIKKYYPESEFLDLECEILLSDEDIFNKFLDKLRYLNFRVDIRQKIEEFDKRSKTACSCIKIATFLFNKNFLERLTKYA